MTHYFIKRLLLVVPTIFLVTVVVFTLIRLLPGDVVGLMAEQSSKLGGQDASIRAELGLDKPFLEQYLNWASGLLRGDFGRSLWTQRTAIEELSLRVPVSLELGLMALAMAVCVAVPIGVLSAIRQDTIIDYVMRTAAILALAIPGFWLATLIIVLPSIWFKWTPSLKLIPLAGDPLGNLLQFAVPAAVLAAERSASIMRMTRAMMLEVMRLDYVRTARAKGLRGRVVIYRHALKNAMIPVVTIIGLQLPLILGGTVIIETIFSLPGVGSLTLLSLRQRDYPMLQAVVLFYATAVVLLNVGVDLFYGWLDPKVRFA